MIGGRYGLSSKEFTPAMAWDSWRGVVVLHGGQSGGTSSDSTWEWDGTSWSYNFV